MRKFLILFCPLFSSALSAVALAAPSSDFYFKKLNDALAGKGKQKLVLTCGIADLNPLNPTKGTVGDIQASFEVSCAPGEDCLDYRYDPSRYGTTLGTLNIWRNRPESQIPPLPEVAMQLYREGDRYSGWVRGGVVIEIFIGGHTRKLEYFLSPTSEPSADASPFDPTPANVSVISNPYDQQWINGTPNADIYDMRYACSFKMENP